MSAPAPHVLSHPPGPSHPDEALPLGAGHKQALALLLAGAVVLGLLASLQQIVSSRYPLQTWLVLRALIPDYLIIMGAAIPAYFAARRFPIVRGRLLSGTLAAGAVVAAGILVLAGFRTWLLPYVDWMSGAALPDWTSFRDVLTNRLFGRTINILLATVSGYAYCYLEQAAAEQQRRVKLQGKLTEYELRMLRQQLQPHFLFNTLQSISTLMMSDVEGAQKMLRQLGDLLRHALENNGLAEVTLEEELEVLQLYLAIEQIRLGERLRLELNIAPDVHDALVPQMVLQPLVENAIRHGIARREHGGALAIRAWREGGDVRLSVENESAPGAPPRFAPGGFGISNTRARLERLYGAEASLEIGAVDAERVRAVLRLPYRRGRSRSVAAV
jgi:two-component system LytT family sensor kinase